MPIVLQVPVASGLIGQPNPYPIAPSIAQLPVDPYSLPHSTFDDCINEFGVRMTWQKSHACPCAWFQTTTVPRGTPNPECLTCSGLGWYWDAPVGPVPILFTFAHSPLATDEPGVPLDPKIGQIINSSPLITVGHDLEFNIWNQASEYDKWTEIDAIWRFNANLDSQRNITLPYNSGIQLATTGAVATYNPQTSSVVQVTGYVLSGSTVVIPSSYPVGTPYVVEFYANPIWVTFKRAGGLPHDRPFSGNNIPANPLPRRFRAAPLDLWLRNKNSF